MTSAGMFSMTRGTASSILNRSWLLASINTANDQHAPDAAEPSALYCASIGACHLCPWPASRQVAKPVLRFCDWKWVSGIWFLRWIHIFADCLALNHWICFPLCFSSPSCKLVVLMAQTGWKRPELGWSGRRSGRPYYSHYSKARESRERCQSLLQASVADSFWILNTRPAVWCEGCGSWKQLLHPFGCLKRLPALLFEPSALSRTTSPYEHVEKHPETILGSVSKASGEDPTLSLLVMACETMWNPLKNPMAAEQQHLLHPPEDWMRNFAKQPRNWQQTAKQEMQRVWLAYRMTLPLAESASSPNWLLNSKQCEWRAYSICLKRLYVINIDHRNDTTHHGWHRTGTTTQANNNDKAKP